MDPELELLDRWCAGDRSAGNALFQRHFDSVCRFFENKLDRDVDELVQATFLACLSSREQFRRQCSFRTYLFTIARHELYAYLRQRQRHEFDFSVSSIADLCPSPRSRLERDEQQELLLRALRTLPVEQQVLIELHYWEGMTPVELAEVLDVAGATARTRLFRARQALRERMEELAGKPAPIYQSVEDLDAWARSLRASGADRERE